VVYKTHFRFFFIIESSLLLKAGLFTALSLGLLLNGFCFFGAEPVTRVSYLDTFDLPDGFYLAESRQAKWFNAKTMMLFHGFDKNWLYDQTYTNSAISIPSPLAFQVQDQVAELHWNLLEVSTALNNPGEAITIPQNLLRFEEDQALNLWVPEEDFFIPQNQLGFEEDPF